MSNKKTKNRTLKFKIMVMALSIILLSSLGISGLVYWKTSQNNKKVVMNTVTDKVDLINERLDALTNNITHSANLLIESGLLKNTLTPDEENAMYAEFEKFTKQYPEIVNILFDRHDYMYIFPRNAEFEAANEGGVPSETDFYKERASEKSDSNWSETYVDDATGQLIVTYYKKIYENGTHIGFIEIDLSLEHIKELIETIHITESSSVVITDFDGLVNLSTGDYPLTQTLENQDLLNYATQNESGNFFYDEKSGEKFAVLKTIAGAVHWKVLAIIEPKDLYADSNVFLRDILFYALLIGIISIVVSVIMSENIVKNIRKFNENLNQLGQGDLTTYCTINSNDELAEMCDVFNETIEKIRDLIKSTQDTCGNLLDGFSDMSHKSKENTQAINLIVESIQEIAEGATEQASETTRIANHFGELSGAMKYIDKSLVEINDMVASTQETNSAGMVVVKNLLDVTEVTNESNDKVRNSIIAINETSAEIDNIVKSINKMAKDAKSLNSAPGTNNGNDANILAENLANSAKVVKELVDRVKQQTSLAVNEMENSKEKTKIQTNAVKETGESFNSLNKDINKLNTHVKNIGVLNNNMIIIKNSMTDIIQNLATKADINSEATQSISAMTEEQLATMLEIDEHLCKLTNASEYLKKEISKFKTKQQDN